MSHAPDVAAGTLGTMVQQILDDLHLLVDTARVKRAIVTSLQFHRSNRLFFSERPLEFTLTSGRKDYAPGDGYGLPADLVELVGRKLFLRLNGSPTQTQHVDWVTPEELDLQTSYNDTNGWPLYWNFNGVRLTLWPTPNRSTDIVTARYVTNIGIPKFRWNGTSYDFFAPEGVTLTDDFTNSWFESDTGESLIRFRAMYELLRAMKDPDADSWLGRWLEAKSALEDETDEKTAESMMLIPRLF